MPIKNEEFSSENLMKGAKRVVEDGSISIDAKIAVAHAYELVAAVCAHLEALETSLQQIKNQMKQPSRPPPYSQGKG